MRSPLRSGCQVAATDGHTAASDFSGFTSPATHCLRFSGGVGAGATDVLPATSDSSGASCYVRQWPHPWRLPVAYAEDGRPPARSSSGRTHTLECSRPRRMSGRRAVARDGGATARASEQSEVVACHAGAEHEGARRKRRVRRAGRGRCNVRSSAVSAASRVPGFGWLRYLQWGPARCRRHRRLPARLVLRARAMSDRGSGCASGVGSAPVPIEGVRR